MKKAIFAFGLVLLLISSTPAAAYLDPGSGSMFLQIVLGGFAAILLAIKIFWHRILAFFGKKSDSENAESSL